LALEARRVLVELSLAVEIQYFQQSLQLVAAQHRLQRLLRVLLVLTEDRAAVARLGNPAGLEQVGKVTTAVLSKYRKRWSMGWRWRWR
jgi:hypothetical protein